MMRKDSGSVAIASTSSPRRRQATQSVAETMNHAPKRPFS
jgi:hypothetical protein